MKRINIRLQKITLILSVLCMCTFSVTSKNRFVASSFNFNKWSYEDIVIPYREVVITSDGKCQKPALVIYLHGGSKRGSDNISQMGEEAIYTIANYISKKRINALMVVPQCPDSLTWGARTIEAVKSMVDKYVTENKVNPHRIYLLGGSMGGAGTWLMASTYPQLFAAIMPVAGNPENADATLLANTPVYTVVGTDDDLIAIQPVQLFIDKLKKVGGEALLDIEKGWSHVKTCTDSYTEQRLNWLFGHERL